MIPAVLIIAGVACYWLSTFITSAPGSDGATLAMILSSLGFIVIQAGVLYAAAQVFVRRELMPRRSPPDP